MTTRIQDVAIPSAIGTLEGLLNVPERTVGAAVVCHPHPQYGGTMHSHVVYHTARALRERGLAVLRFNFRGVGRSAGAYDEGRGEMDDVRAALDFMHERFEQRPMLLAGFSFGSWVGLRVGVADPRVWAMLAVGLPVGSYDFAFLRAAAAPVAIVQGGGDPHGDVAAVRALIADLKTPVRLEEIPGAGHFFAEQLNELRAAVGRSCEWLEAA